MFIIYKGFSFLNASKLTSTTLAWVRTMISIHRVCFLQKPHDVCCITAAHIWDTHLYPSCIRKALLSKSFKLFWKRRRRGTSDQSLCKGVFEKYFHAVCIISVGVHLRSAHFPNKAIELFIVSGRFFIDLSVGIKKKTWIKKKMNHNTPHFDLKLKWIKTSQNNKVTDLLFLNTFFR